MNTSQPSEPGRLEPAPGIVARIADRLDSIERDGTASEHVAAMGDDIETFGLPPFFQAVSQFFAVRGVPTETAAPVAAVPPTGSAAGLAGWLDDASVRQTWADCIGSRTAQPLRLFRPINLAELQSIVQRALAEGCRVKAVGSGHSFADVAVTRDFLVETHGLDRPLALERDLLRPGPDADGDLFETEAGIRIGALNEELWDAGLGLVNMGGYDGQTIAGAVSTSTHGSGLAFGSLASQVVSLTLVAGDGLTYRVEPSDGITDPLRWAARHPEIRLVQDDDWFYSCQVGLGCMGVIYSLVLRVRPRYYLREQRTLSVWSQVKSALQDGRVLREGDHYELLVNPYPTNGDHTCLITRRGIVPEPDDSPIEWPRRNFLVELVASIPGSNSALLTVLDGFPALTPRILDEAMKALAHDYVDRSYRVFNIGTANEVPGYGSEIGFTLDRYLDAVERIFAIAEQRQRLGRAYLTSPFSLRFVQEARAYMSMMEGADTCMIEFPMLDRTVGGRELLQEIETEMYAFGGRPHWGLLNFLSGANGLIEAMYPKLPRWLELFDRLNPNGTFDNAFTERCGFTRRTFVRP